MVLRVPVVSRGLQDNLENLEREDAPEQTVPAGCLESPVPRVTEALTDSLDCLVKKDTEGSQGQWDPPVLLEKTDREARMERSDPEGCLARAALEVCSGPAAPQGLLDHLVLPELMGLQVPKGTWDLKESQAHLDNRESPELRVFLVLKAPLGHPVKKDLRAGQGCLGYLELMALLVILVRRVPLERKEAKVQWVHRVLSVILALVVSRVPTVSVV